MAVKITNVKKGSVAEKLGLVTNSSIISIDKNEINDMLDYEFYTAKAHFQMAAFINEKLEYLDVKKEEYEPFGCDFETYLIDKKHSCKNKCMFCFIDQLPKGMRETLYFKDDDERLSFLYGNYITLTNFTQHEIDRIKNMHISPINISVHTTNPELRVKMMKNKSAGEVLKYIGEFADAGIQINAQIVLCRDVNDGAELEKTLTDLMKLYPNVQSIAVVPFGMTGYRENLPQIKPFDKESAENVLQMLDKFGDECAQKNGERVVYGADELFLMAQRQVPKAEYYDDFPQLENGIGMYRQFVDGFERALPHLHTPFFPMQVDCATGVLAYPLINASAKMLMKKYKCLKISVHPIKNNFFGGNVNVAGLVTGTDIIDQLKGKLISGRLIIPESMLRDEEDMFLDDVRVKDVETALGVTVCVSPQSGDGFAKTVLKRKIRLKL